MTPNERTLSEALHLTSHLEVSTADTVRARAGLATGIERHRRQRRWSAIAVTAVVIALVAGSLWWGSGRGFRALSPADQPSMSTTADQTPSTRRALAEYPDAIPTAGFIGFPPPGATPSEPEHATLVDNYVLFQNELPFRGSVRLYADGRLIWYLFVGITTGGLPRSTGYLEQRLTAEGVELVRAMPATHAKHPWNLETLLPPTAWADPTIRAYVPTRYAFCGGPFNPNAPVESRVWGTPGVPKPREELLALFPTAVAALLEGRPAVPPLDDDEECLAMTTAEARELHAALLSGGFTQDEEQNRFVLQYEKAMTGSSGTILVGRLEPVFPDGSVGCSSCG